MNSDIKQQIKQTMEYLAKQRGLDITELTELIQKSLREAARKAIQNYQDVDASIDPKTGALSCCAKLTVVETVADPSAEISLGMARTQFPNAELGEVIDWPIKVENFGRIAAQSAKQVITTGLQDAEKRHIVSTFESQEGQLISGTFQRRDKNGIWIDFGNTEGLMPPKGCIPGEEYEPGDIVTVLLRTLNPDKPGPSLYVTRASPDFVRRLFEREVSEIMDGTVVIKAIAREPGYRTKIAVYSEQSKVDPVGACVGLRGARVRAIVNELSGEKVDIINWSPDIRTYVENALKPAKLAKVTVHEAEKTLDVRVTDDQLSLSIGKKGQNARLAAKLTGWKINIERIEPETNDQSSVFEEQMRQAIDFLAQTCGIDAAAAKVLVENGYHSIEGLREASLDDLIGLEGIDEETARRILAAIGEQPAQ